MTKSMIAILAVLSAAAVPGVVIACDNHGPGEHPSGLTRFNPFAAELAAYSAQERRATFRDARTQARRGAGLSVGGRAIFI